MLIGFVNLQIHLFVKFSKRIETRIQYNGINTVYPEEHTHAQTRNFDIFYVLPLTLFATSTQAFPLLTKPSNKKWSVKLKLETFQLTIIENYPSIVCILVIITKSEPYVNGSFKFQIHFEKCYNYCRWSCVRH